MLWNVMKADFRNAGRVSDRIFAVLYNLWITIFLFAIFAKVVHNVESTPSANFSEKCVLLGTPEQNVTLMQGLDNPKITTRVLSHVGGIQECVEAACKQDNISLIYLSRNTCFGVDCHGQKEACRLSPSFDNPSFVFARVQRTLSVGDPLKIETVRKRREEKIQADSLFSDSHDTSHQSNIIPESTIGTSYIRTIDKRSSYSMDDSSSPPYLRKRRRKIIEVQDRGFLSNNDQGADDDDVLLIDALKRFKREDVDDDEEKPWVGDKASSLVTTDTEGLNEKEEVVDKERLRRFKRTDEDDDNDDDDDETKTLNKILSSKSLSNDKVENTRTKQANKMNQNSASLSAIQETKTLRKEKPIIEASESIHVTGNLTKRPNKIASNHTSFSTKNGNSDNAVKISVQQKLINAGVSSFLIEKQARTQSVSSESHIQIPTPGGTSQALSTSGNSSSPSSSKIQSSGSITISKSPADKSMGKQRQEQNGKKHMIPQSTSTESRVSISLSGSQPQSSTSSSSSNSQSSSSSSSASTSATISISKSSVDKSTKKQGHGKGKSNKRMIPQSSTESQVSISVSGSQPQSSTSSSSSNSQSSPSSSSSTTSATISISKSSADKSTRKQGHGKGKSNKRMIPQSSTESQVSISVSGSQPQSSTSSSSSNSQSSPSSSSSTTSATISISKSSADKSTRKQGHGKGKSNKRMIPQSSSENQVLISVPGSQPQSSTSSSSSNSQSSPSSSSSTTSATISISKSSADKSTRKQGHGKGTNNKRMIPQSSSAESQVSISISGIQPQSSTSSSSSNSQSSSSSSSASTSATISISKSSADKSTQKQTKSKPRPAKRSYPQSTDTTHTSIQISSNGSPQTSVSSTSSSTSTNSGSSQSSKTSQTTSITISDKSSKKSSSKDPKKSSLLPFLNKAAIRGSSPEMPRKKSDKEINKKLRLKEIKLKDVDTKGRKRSPQTTQTTNIQISAPGGRTSTSSTSTSSSSTSPSSSSSKTSSTTTINITNQDKFQGKKRKKKTSGDSKMHRRDAPKPLLANVKTHERSSGFSSKTSLSSSPVAANSSSSSKRPDVPQSSSRQRQVHVSPAPSSTSSSSTSTSANPSLTSPIMVALNAKSDMTKKSIKHKKAASDKNGDKKTSTSLKKTQHARSTKMKKQNNPSSKTKPTKRQSEPNDSSVKSPGEKDDKIRRQVWYGPRNNPSGITLQEVGPFSRSAYSGQPSRFSQQLSPRSYTSFQDNPINRMTMQPQPGSIDWRTNPQRAITRIEFPITAGGYGVGIPTLRPYITSSTHGPSKPLIPLNTIRPYMGRETFPRNQLPRIQMSNTYVERTRFPSLSVRPAVTGMTPLMEAVVNSRETIGSYGRAGSDTLEPSCRAAVGIQSGAIQDSQMTSSSEFSKFHTASRGRLQNTASSGGLAGAWCSGGDHVDKAQFLQVDLGKRSRVCGVATQGMHERPLWVTSYTLEFSNNGRIWADYTESGHLKLFNGNFDQDSIVTNPLKQPITAQYVRVRPRSWNGASICMRAELYTSHDEQSRDNARDKIPEKGLIVYLDFDGEAAGLYRRMDISRAPGVCGDVARMRDGGSVALDGSQLKTKPGAAVTIAAWIRLEDTNGVHTIFGTSGDHVDVADGQVISSGGQYRLEVRDGAVNWYHSNSDTGDVFKIKTEPVIKAKKWTHITGTYDAHTGLAKVYTDGHVTAQAHGTGQLSDDWGDQATVGRTKKGDFLDGTIDEFRVYNRALGDAEIQNLINMCNYSQDCGSTLRASEGTINSPNWPQGYKGSKTCTWRISVNPSDSIALFFNSFNLQEDGNCDKSKLAVRDGGNESAHEIGAFCGLNSPRVMRSKGGELWIQFTSADDGEGKGFHLTYKAEPNRETKKQEEPVPPSKSPQCYVSTPEHNVTLTGGIKSGVFTEAPEASSLDTCTRACCLKPSCDISFMISSSCYLVTCYSEELCKTKRARASSLHPTIVFLRHTDKGQKQIGQDQLLNNDALQYNPTQPHPQREQKCHHTEVSHNVTLVGGIKAGKFNTYGRMDNMDDCIRHCCHDDKCNVAFMIQGNCYSVDCVDKVGCAMKRAKPSPYNPTLAYVYRGMQKPIAEPLKKPSQPNKQACDSFDVSSTLSNVTLEGGVKSGKFTDRGVVGSMEECRSFCCAEDTCNVAFTIRSNCFLVACKDYDSCKVKPALSDYYHPRLAYVNWSPPDAEVPAGSKFASLGCWRDTEGIAIPSLEGAETTLMDTYDMRPKPIDTCANAASKHGYKVFAIQRGGVCLSGPHAEETFNKFGESSDCKDGRGGKFANDVYRLNPDASYTPIGCWRDSSQRALRSMEHTDTKLDDFYLSRDSPIEKCASVAQKRGYPVFALQNGGECYSGPGAETEYTKFGVSRDCRGKLGGPYANSVFRLIGKFDSENVPTIANTTDSDGSTKQSMSKPNASGTFVVDKAPASDEPTPTNSGVSSSGTGSSTDELSSMQEDFVTMQNGVPKRIHYTAGPIHENVTLKYGISSGKFMDQGRVRTIHECIRMCGRQPDCDLAFMLGVQCFSVGCKSKSLCVTKPAFSAFYNPKITFVTHRKVFEAVSSHKRCQSSFIENDVTLQGGINAGKFTDLGQMTDMRECVQRCCAKSTCDVAFMLEDECYGVSCISNTLCKTRPARNPGRYKPKVAYVYHDGKGLDSAEELTRNDTATRTRGSHYKLSNNLKSLSNLSDDLKNLSNPTNGLKNLSNLTDDLQHLSNQNTLSNLSNQMMFKASSQHLTPLNIQPNNTISAIDPDHNTTDLGKLKLLTALQMTGTMTNDQSLSTDNSIRKWDNNFGNSQNVTHDTYDKTSRANLSLSTIQMMNATNTKETNLQGLWMPIKLLHEDTAMGGTGSKKAAIKNLNDYSIKMPVKGMYLHRVDHTRRPMENETVVLNTKTDNEEASKNINAGITIFHDLTKNAKVIGSPPVVDNITRDAATDAKSISTDVKTIYDLKGNATVAMTLPIVGNITRVAATAKNVNADVTIDLTAINVSKTEGSAMSPTGSPPNDTHVCWDSDVLYNQTLIGGINAGVFTDNGKASTMDLCMQFCCKRKDCDLAFMIEDDCYSVACSSTRSCKTRKARPTQFYPRIAFTRKFRGEASKAVSGLVSGDTITPETASSDDAADSGKPSPTTEPTAGMSVKQPIKVHHSCSATPIKYNVTLRMGLHSGLFTKMGRVDSMDDCIELSCKKDKTDVAFMMGQHCYSVQCYSEDLCRTEPVYGTTISGLNLTPAVSFLRNNPGTSGTELAYQDNPREQCLGSSITYNVTLRGGIKAGKFREQTDVRSMRDCVSKCCDESSCDLAFMFGERCYSVTCQSEKLCQAVMAKPTNLQPKISYLSKNYGGDRGISLAETGLDTKQPTCKEDDIARTHIARNKTLAGGLEAGTFKFLGKVKAMKSCMRMCCALRSCDVAYMFDRNCFSISCFSPDLCHVTDFPTSNGDVEISTMVKTVKKEKLPEETHSVIVYIVVGAVLLLAGVAGIVWAVCMFLRRHRLKMRHQQRRDST
ncbi:uncharacterized protein LOC5518116 isoform X2 [Nematostella vectensis]|uniref:uncharacterized protein LOC5518116 isoform X2 n=1 Tax=Nematostella vectensis TaxID=45351 RepID=UPI0020777880|nr:uncharacterized protein LOC5518116 isoform X2 [Nematostella vectensis]